VQVLDPSWLSQAITPDGTRMIVSTPEGALSVPLDAANGTRAPETTRLSETRALTPHVSPDGRWVVYSDNGLFVQPFPGPGLRRQVAPNGTVPRWRADGAEIVAVASNGIMSISVDMKGPEPRFGAPVLLFRDVLRPPGTVNAASLPLAVSRDGSTFYWLQGVEQPGPEAIYVRTKVVD
jgi:hypothetical protein